MTDDPIVEDVRRWRDEYAKQFNYDIVAIFEDLRKREAESGRQVVSFPPRPVEGHPVDQPAPNETKEQNARRAS